MNRHIHYITYTFISIDSESHYIYDNYRVGDLVYTVTEHFPDKNCVKIVIHNIAYVEYVKVVLESYIL